MSDRHVLEQRRPQETAASTAVPRATRDRGFPSEPQQGFPCRHTDVNAENSCGARRRATGSWVGSAKQASHGAMRRADGSDAAGEGRDAAA